MKTDLEERACALALYIIENNATVRDTARKYGISKSTVHKDVTRRLAGFNRSLAAGVEEVLSRNKAERHLRGGRATREKYAAARAVGGGKC